MNVVARLNMDFIGVGQCCICGVPMVLTKDTYERAREDSKQVFYCERGHQQFFRDGEVQRLQKELERKTKELEWSAQSVKNAWRQVDDEKRKAAAARGVATRIKNRVGNGVCPCCNRSFANLKRHMESKHSDFVKGEE